MEVETQPSLFDDGSPPTPQTGSDRNLRGDGLYTPREERAIRNHLRQNPHLALTLQAEPGKVLFVDKTTKDLQREDVASLLETYDTDRKEAAKERARARRLKEKAVQR